MQTASINKVLQLFNSLSKQEQLEIAERIDQQTFKDRWKMADTTLPDANLPEDDIMNEVRAVRYGKKD